MYTLNRKNRQYAQELDAISRSIWYNENHEQG